MSLTSCSGEDTVVAPAVTPTPTPTPTPSPTPTPVPAINLEKFAAVQATSECTSTDGCANASQTVGQPLRYRAFMARDGKFGNALESWVSDFEGNAANITFRFIGEVEVDTVKLTDNPSTNQNLKAGHITFENIIDPTSADLGQVNFGELPNNGATPLSVDIGKKKITGLTVHLTSYDDLTVPAGHDSRNGLAEVEIMGRFVADQTIQRKNIAVYARADALGTGLPKIKFNTTNSQGQTVLVTLQDVGNFGAMNAIDELDASVVNDETCAALSPNKDVFKSDGVGANTEMRINFDREYEVDRVLVYDLQGTTDHHLKSFKLMFSDGQSTTPISFAAGQRCKVVDIPDPSILAGVTAPITTSFVQVHAVEVENADGQHNDVGFAEIRVFGKFNP